MSDTTEAMRAAFEAWAKAYGRIFLDRQPSGNYRHVFTQEAWVGWQAALTHPTPAAPAVTDSTHTGAVPLHPITATVMRDDGGDSPAFCLMAAYRTEQEAAHALRLASGAQPSPERNDCEPVAVIEQNTPIPKPLSKDPALGSEFWIAMYGKADGPHYWGGGHWDRVALGAGNCYATQAEALYAAPPPPAERHYCERCGKRLGHTEGVHTCTPPTPLTNGAAERISEIENLLADLLRESLGPLEVSAALIESDAGQQMEELISSIKRALRSIDNLRLAATKEPQQ